MSGRVAIFDAVSGRRLHDLRAPIRSSVAARLVPLLSSRRPSAPPLRVAGTSTKGPLRPTESSSGMDGKSASLATEDESIATEDMAYVMMHRNDEDAGEDGEDEWTSASPQSRGVTGGSNEAVGATGGNGGQSAEGDEDEAAADEEEENGGEGGGRETKSASLAGGSTPSVGSATAALLQEGIAKSGGWEALLLAGYEDGSVRITAFPGPRLVKELKIGTTPDASQVAGDLSSDSAALPSVSICSATNRGRFSPTPPPPPSPMRATNYRHWRR